MLKKAKILIIVLLSIFFLQCSAENRNIITDPHEILCRDTIVTDTLPVNSSVTNITEADTCDFEKILVYAKLVDVRTMDSSIKVDLKYSSVNNFIGIDIYGDLNKAYLQKDAAEKLVYVQKMLKDTFPEYNLLIYDAVRPRSVQKIMWENFKMPESEKSKYLAHPEIASMHCYGIAVDLTIIDERGKALDMGTEFDSFEELAYPMLEEKMHSSGRLTLEQLKNRKLLRSLMSRAGFRGITTEWWHFSLYNKSDASIKYAIIESHILPEKPELIAETLKMEPVKSGSSDINFRVQIKLSDKKISLKSPVFKGLDVWQYHHEGLYKYTTGKFNNLAEAYEYREKIKEMGFSDCFVAGFDRDQRIGIRDAVDLNE